MTARRVVRERIDPRLTASLFANYPLYEVRKGDLWYQLETALREVCVTLPEATVPEFERKVNELMSLSLSLAGHRRTRRRATPAVKGAWIRG